MPDPKLFSFPTFHNLLTETYSGCHCLQSPQKYITANLVTIKIRKNILGACGDIASMNDVAFVLSRHNLDLISVDFWKSYSLSPLGVQALASCTKLQELDLGWW